MFAIGVILFVLFFSRRGRNSIHRSSLLPLHNVSQRLRRTGIRTERKILWQDKSNDGSPC